MPIMNLLPEIKVIALFIIGIFLSIFYKKLKVYANNLVNLVLFNLSLRKTVYKKKTREMLNSMEQILDERPDAINIKFKESDKISDDEWEIIKIDKSLDNKGIEQSVIFQIPKSSTFFRERNLLYEKYNQALYLALSSLLASSIKRYDVTSEISSKVNKENINFEYKVIDSIFRDKEKLKIFVEEARRRFKKSGGNIPPSSKTEFVKFIKDLSDGKVGVIRIDKSHLPEKYIEEYINQINKFLSNNFKKVYILAIGKNQDKKVDNLHILNELIEMINKLEEINLEDMGIYTWDSMPPNEKELHKGRTIIVNKKDKNKPNEQSF